MRHFGFFTRFRRPFRTNSLLPRYQTLACPANIRSPSRAKRTLVMDSPTHAGLAAKRCWRIKFYARFFRQVRPSGRPSGTFFLASARQYFRIIEC
jgi:hypothetical protein